jgi:hypothetical protein
VSAQGFEKDVFEPIQAGALVVEGDDATGFPSRSGMGLFADIDADDVVARGGQPPLATRPHPRIA